MEDIFRSLIPYLDPFFLIYFTIIIFIYALSLTLGMTTVYRRKREINFEDLEYLLHSNSLPEITFLVPSYNEEEDIVSTINNLLNLSYRYKQVIVINDGSTDNTMTLVKEKFNLIPIAMYYHETLHTQKVRTVYKSLKNPELIIIDKENGGRHDALNAGVNACLNYYFICVDADTFIDDSSFEAIVHPMLTSPKMIAMGASIRIRNGCTFSYRQVTTNLFPQNFLPAVQSNEYLRSFLMKDGWEYLGGNICLSGAFSIFVTDIVRKAGGYAATFANDLEITLRLNRIMLEMKKNYSITYVPDPAAWTDVPTTLKVLGKQRSVWHRGTIESAWFHKKMFFNPRYGKYGMIVFPYLVFGEILEPVMELLGYIYILLGLYFGVFQPYSVLLLGFIIWAFTFAYTTFCLLIEEITFNKYPSLRSFGLLFLCSIVENLGYRQLTVFWRVHGFYDFFRRFKQVRKESKIINEEVDKMVREKKNVVLKEYPIEETG